MLVPPTIPPPPTPPHKGEGRPAAATAQIPIIVVPTGSGPCCSRPLRPEGAGRDQARGDVGVVQGVELRPQHVALEAHGVDAGCLLLGRGRRAA